MHIDVQHGWVPRAVHRAALFLALGLLLLPWAWTRPRVALALASPSGRGQVSRARPAGVHVNVFNGNLSCSQTGLPFTCTNRTLSLDVHLTYDSQDAQAGQAHRPLHGWRSPHDIHYQAEGNRAVTFYWSGGGSVRSTPVESGGARARTQIHSSLGGLVHEQVWYETLSGSEVRWLDTAWQSEARAIPGTYSVLQEACDRHHECCQNQSSFVVKPLDTRLSYLPPVVTDLDRSTAGRGRLPTNPVAGPRRELINE